MKLPYFHPAVRAWFTKKFESPTEPQQQAWPAIKTGQHTLIAAPTGSGKTLAAFLSAIDDLVRKGVDGKLENETYVVYITPLKALSNDIHYNLEQPLEGIQQELKHLGLPQVDIRTMVRTGDTPQKERDAMRRNPPHIIVTTPESFYILLTSDSGRRMLSTVHTVIVDEIHALANSKRGSHLTLSLQRLETLTESKITRIGLSATQRPIEKVAQFLTRTSHSVTNGTNCTIIDVGHIRERDLALELPRSPLEAVMSNEVWEEVYDQLTDLINQHQTTLIFVNTRRRAERLTRHLSERIGEDKVTSHHGSLSREHRLNAERRLKNGELRALVATASLELGIDIGNVELVCQLGSTRSIATFLQRVGRSGHTIDGIPKGRLFPLSRDDLAECTAMLDAIRRGELDELHIPSQPLDVLAQQIVAEVSCREWQEDELFECFCRAYPFRELKRDDFNAVVRMLADGYSTRRGRNRAYLHRDAVNKKLRARRGARLSAITCGGTIPDNGDYDVILEPTGIRIGSVNEDFAIESLAGDIFQLGNTSYRILRIETGCVRVEDAHGLPPNIPFWFGEAPGRTDELSFAVSRLREEVTARLCNTATAQSPLTVQYNTNEPSIAEPLSLRSDMANAVHWLINDRGLSNTAAEQLVDYLASAQAAFGGVLPTHKLIVFERFFDEAGDMHMVIHSPYGSRLNRAWGLALRKRFCRKFNFELQAAATEDAIVLSLGTTHSFPLDEVARYLNAKTVRQILIQALLAAPMFTVRWRWNASIALAVLRFRAGKRIPPQLQRMDAEDLIAVAFPDQLACFENLAGDREIPDHPLVNQTIQDCLEQTMDIQGLESMLTALERGDIKVIARDLLEPSPLAQEILNAQPYAFLDDAPLEERRTQAVMSRRWITPETAADLGKLDSEAIQRVREEAWPIPTQPDELHEALILLGYMSDEEIAGIKNVAPMLDTLIDEKRATWMTTNSSIDSDSGRIAVSKIVVAAERLPQFLALFPKATIDPFIAAPEEFSHNWEFERAVVEILRGRLEGQGPVTVDDLARSLGVSRSNIESALLALEAEGFVMRGNFTHSNDAGEWCERRLLARIHRYTLNRLRREIEPVSSADFMRFLFHWQRIDTEQQGEGPQALASVVDQLEGFEAPAAAWESDILPARLSEYSPEWLDNLCLSGRTIWTRLTPPKSSNNKERSAGPIRSTPVVLLNRKNTALWNEIAPFNNFCIESLSSIAKKVFDYLSTHGASFFEDLSACGLLRTQIENALGELAAWGLVNSDSFNGLRALLIPSERRRPVSGARRKRGRVALFGIEEAGRWVLLKKTNQGAQSDQATNGHREKYPPQSMPNPEALEYLAQTLLRRYGVVFRKLLEREPNLPVWRDLILVYRRMEARGEIRGGRFVDGFSGEQFALPEAVGSLREIRRQAKNGLSLSISAADPLNLTGIITPGAKVPTLASNRILYRDGIPVATHIAGEVQFLAGVDPQSEWEARNALLRQHIPPGLRSYLARPV